MPNWDMCLLNVDHIGCNGMRHIRLISLNNACIIKSVFADIILSFYEKVDFAKKKATCFVLLMMCMRNAFRAIFTCSLLRVCHYKGVVAFRCLNKFLIHQDDRLFVMP